MTACPDNGYWTVCLRKKTKYEACESPHVRLFLKQASQKIGVFVDYEKGLVSFYDADAMSHIYSFTSQCFTHTLYPIFCPFLNNGGKNSAPLIITPIERTEWTLLSEDKSTPWTVHTPWKAFLCRTESTAG